MKYQPDYRAAIREAEHVVGPDYAERVVMALIKSGEMVCVPNRANNHSGRKTQKQLSDENAALRDWMGVMMDEYCDSVNYHQYIDYAKQLLRRLYSKASTRPPMPPLPLLVAADRLANYAGQHAYANMDLREAVRAYWRVRGSRK
jgi:hypothetical protein